MPVKSGVTIEHDEEHINTIRLPSQYHWRSNSIVAMNSSLFSTDNILDSTIISPSKIVDITSDNEKLSSPLLLVGNAKKYSITQTKAKEQQIAKSAQRSFFHSQRDYGEVYVRHRVNSFVFNISLKTF
jgi:carbonic anhydrase/acetyltransferase-like protein (isoleucine patch superfamily)